MVDKFTGQEAQCTQVEGFTQKYFSKREMLVRILTSIRFSACGPWRRDKFNLEPC